MILTMGYCHFVSVKRIQDLATAGFLLSAMKALFASFRLSLGGIEANRVLIVESAETDRQCMDCRMYRTPSRGGLCGLG